MFARAGAVALLVVALQRCAAEHACEKEVTSACPDRPGADMAGCLNDKTQHDNPTEISSDCTDFIALNTACTHELTKFCDDAFFSDDTVLCLTQWTDIGQLSERCAAVVKWAVPEPEDDEDDFDAPTDELGLSEEDYKEKQEWLKKRKEQRGYSVDKLKMKEADRKKEEERAAMDEFKKTDPEGYQQMMEQQAEERRQQAEQKRRERMLAAAYERKKMEEQGISGEPNETTEPKPRKKRKASSAPRSKSASGDSWLPALAGLGVVGALCALGLWAVFRMEKSSKKSVRKPKKKN